MDMFSRRIVPCLFLVMLGCFQQHAHAGDVFAHFMVGVANRNTIDDWTDDINKAKEAHIDGFALNIGAGDSSNAASLENAFTVANNTGGFQLFLSFDYQALGPWDPSKVVALINQYKNNSAYYNYEGRGPLVSTFEGTDSADKWRSIKQQTGCFFMPDWSSLGPQAAVNTGVVDGLFFWEAWPNGISNMTIEPDRSYKSVLADKPYMMPVSPWFYTNLPKYGKDCVKFRCVRRGDDLWYDRWQQVFDVNPELVQIISWNDYGESHYIGPLRSADFGLFNQGGAPYNYVENMPHDGWRAFLPYLIDTYRNGSPPPIASEQVVVWYRLHPALAERCNNTEGADTGILQDKIFYSALLGSDADVTVTIGSTTRSGTWRNRPGNGNPPGSGIYHGNIDFGGATGAVNVKVSRNGGADVVQVVQGPPITTVCKDGFQNWNAWVGPAPTP